MKVIMLLPVLMLTLAGCSASIGTPATTTSTTYHTPAVSSTTYAEPATGTTVTHTSYN